MSLVPIFVVEVAEFWLISDFLVSHFRLVSVLIADKGCCALYDTTTFSITFVINSINYKSKVRI